ncbi:MAG: four helix bundle protein [Candidatus Magasanikbacteria bacterium]
MGTYKDLDVYNRSFKCSIAIYKLSLELPKYLQYDIADDIRRAARSIPSNIAEGYGRDKSSADKINFLRTSLGSNDEVLFNLEFIFQLGLIKRERYEKAVEQYTIIGAELFKLIQTLK